LVGAARERAQRGARRLLLLSLLLLLKRTTTFSVLPYPVNKQAAAISAAGAAPTQTLFLRDKKRRTYVVAALPETVANVNLKSARLFLVWVCGARFAADRSLFFV
jgi:hypothetical protein